MSRRYEDCQPLVSIVTPSYNQCKYIEATIESVLNQDCQNLEYIVVDGGSTDGTLDILKRYEGRLTWICEKDSGPEHAINKGFRMSHGQLLGWIASDDIYLPGSLKTAVNFFMEQPEIDMLYGKSYYVDEKGTILFEYPTESFDEKALAVYNIICQPSTFFTRRAFFDAGELSLDLKIASDYDLWIRIAQIYSICYIPQFFSHYRLHSEAKTLGFSDQLTRFRECLDITYKYYNWAPANRIYPYCLYLIKQSLSPSVQKYECVIKVLAVARSMYEYLKLNKKIRIDDVKLLPRNLKRLLGQWELKEQLKEYQTINKTE